MNDKNKVEYHHSSSAWEHEYLIQLGERLRYVREKIANISQQEFGKRLNTGRSSVVRYEKGERPCDAVYLRRICDTWGVSPVWLHNGAGVPTETAELNEANGTYAVASGTEYERILDDVYQAVYELESILKNRGLSIDDSKNKAKLIAMCVDYLHKRPENEIEPVSAQILRFIKYGT